MIKSDERWGQTRLGVMVSLVLVLVAGGCDGDGSASGGTAVPEPPASPGEGRPEPTSGITGINGTLLHTLTLGADHAVYFFEMASGDTAVRESLAMGDEQPLLAGLPTGSDLVTVFQAIAPKMPVPEVLRQADRAAWERFQGRAAPVRPTDAPLSVPASQIREADATETRSSALGGPTRGPQLPLCSPDYNNDGYGGDWFINKYCTEGNYRLCVKNQSRLSTEKTGGYKWIQNEGDFARSGHMRGWHWSSCGPYFPFFTKAEYPVEEFSFDVLPRHIEIWSWSNSARCAHGVDGWSGCNHMHVVNATQYP